MSYSRQQLITIIEARTGRPLYELSRKSVAELETLLETSLLAQIREEAQNSSAAIEANQKLAELSRERQHDHAFFHIFRTAINSRVAIDNQANRHIILSWVQEDQGEILSPELFKKILTEQPQLAGQLAWQSADVLDPKKRQRAATAQAQADRKTFAAAARKFGLSDNEASFRLIRETLGEGFSEYAVGQAVNTGAVQVSPATQSELQQYRQEAAEQRQQFLRNADPEMLRSIVRSEAEQRSIQAQREEDQRQIAARQAKDEAFGFPPLPEINETTGEKLNSAYFIRLSNTDLQQFKNYIRYYGASQITRALRGRV